MKRDRQKYIKLQKMRKQRRRMGILLLLLCSCCAFWCGRLTGRAQKAREYNELKRQRQALEELLAEQDLEPPYGAEPGKAAEKAGSGGGTARISCW